MARPKKAATGNSPKESKGDKFKRLAAKRTGTAIAKIRLIASCSNRSSYEYTPEHVQQILLALQNAVRNVAGTFDLAMKGSKVDKESTFSFTEK